MNVYNIDPSFEVPLSPPEGHANRPDSYLPLLGEETPGSDFLGGPQVRVLGRLAGKATATAPDFEWPGGD